MAEIRNRGSVLATETGIQILKDAKAAKRNQNGKMWTYQDIANESGVTNKTVERFFRREKSIDESSARAICQVLEVDFSKVIEIRSSEDAPQKKKREDKWQQVCRGMLDRQKKLSTNEVIASEAMQFDLVNDEIFVSLALVERKEPNRLSQDVHPTRSVEQYEERPPIEYEIFQEQVLEKGKSDRIAIVGEPGAGKTTLLQHIAFWILERGLGLPIWISLGNLMKNGDLQRLKDYLTQVWLEDAIPNVTQDVKSDFLEQLSKQRVWLLLDGADEIVVSSGITLREIDEKLPSWLSQVRILLTCRLNVWDADINALRDFQIYRTKEFHYPTQVEQFIENGFCRSNPSSGQSLKTELAKTEQNRLQQLVRNPLRLMMLCTTWYEQESLPATKAELYGRFVDEFYKWNRTKWRKKDLNFALFPNTKANQEKLNQALGRLACRALDKEPSPFRLSHDLVVEELGDPDEEGSGLWLALNLGWLQVARNSDKSSEKVYTFFHPTFQEYFAALAIDDWNYFLNHISEDPKHPDARYRVFELQWREVIILWFERCEISKNLKKKAFSELLNIQDECGGFYSEKVRSLLKGIVNSRDFGIEQISDQITIEPGEEHTISIAPGYSFYSAMNINHLFDYLGFNTDYIEEIKAVTSGISEVDRLEIEDILILLDRLSKASIKTVRKDLTIKLIRGIILNFDLIICFCKKVEQIEDEKFLLAAAWIIAKVLDSKMTFSDEVDCYYFDDISSKCLLNIVKIHLYLLEKASSLSGYMSIHIIFMSTTTLNLILRSRKISKEVPKTVICELRDHFLNSKDEPNLYTDLYNVILTCTQLPYQDFYEAWHSSPSSTDAELCIDDGEIKP